MLCGTAGQFYQFYLPSALGTRCATKAVQGNRYVLRLGAPLPPQRPSIAFIHNTLLYCSVKILHFHHCSGAPPLGDGEQLADGGLWRCDGVVQGLRDRECDRVHERVGHRSATSRASSHPKAGVGTAPTHGLPRMMTRYDVGYARAGMDTYLLCSTCSTVRKEHTAQRTELLHTPIMASLYKRGTPLVRGTLGVHIVMVIWKSTVYLFYCVTYSIPGTTGGERVHASSVPLLACSVLSAALADPTGPPALCLSPVEVGVASCTQGHQWGKSCPAPESEQPKPTPSHIHLVAHNAQSTFLCYFLPSDNSPQCCPADHAR